MPDRANEFYLPRRFGFVSSKDAVLILIDINPETIILAKDNLSNDGRKFMIGINDVYFANENIIKKHLEFFANRGVEFFPGWQTNIEYKNKLSKSILNDRCFLVNPEEERLYSFAKRGIDYEVVNPYTPNMDIKPISR
jgi:hypothetical protein